MTEPSVAADVAAAAAVAARVQAAFDRVQRERMGGLPFVNESLRVELVGLRRWHGLWLGVLITPWFMNLLLLPGDGASDAADAVPWPRLPVRETARFAFPAGSFEFIAGHEGEAGDYLACSLFSPVFEFADQATARQTADACLAALFDAGTAAPPPAPAEARDRPAAVSKRDFLRGRWSGDAAEGERL